MRHISRPIVTFITSIVILAGGLATTSRGAASRQAQAPPRDLRIEPAGTGILGGRVETDESSPRPLRRALVRLTGDRLMTARLLTTADDGTFQFIGLPTGQYQINASRSTYMTAEYGARRPGGAGSAIVLNEGERRTDIVLRLSRWASIRGTIYDQDGAPAAGISVEALRYTMRTGRRTLSSVYGRPAFTDDEGHYDLGGLSPGEYFVAAGPSPDNGPTDLQRLSVSDVDRALQVLSSSASPSERLVFTERREAFAPVYFPGTTAFPQAQVVALTLGEQRAGVDIRLQLVPTARLDGTLTTSDGQPVTSGQVRATPVTEAQSMDLFDPEAIGSASLDGQGRFSFPALVSGRYMVSARLPSPAAGSASNQGPLWAMTTVAVSGADQTVALVLQPGFAVSGRIVFDGATATPSSFAGLRLNMPDAGTGVTLAVAPATVNADGTFRFAGTPPGRYRLSAAPPSSPAGWVARSALVNGVDALDLPFEVSPDRPVDGVVVTFTDRPTELSGNLQTTDGAPTADYFIIVFTTDRRYWIPSPRRSVMARPASTGRYVVRNLPPGEYFVAAVTDVEQSQWFDPAFLEQLVPAATRITLADGEKKVQDLRIGRQPRP